jgi:hypothetical protein
LHLCYLVATSTGSKLQLFKRWREWELQPFVNTKIGQKLNCKTLCARNR